MPKFTLSDDFEYKGLWWLPGTPQNKVAGTISFDGEVITLDLLGPLHDHTGSESPEEKNPDFILGRAEGRLITIYQTVARRTPGRWSDVERDAEHVILHTSVYEAQHAFFGAHFESQEQRRFEALTASFTHLEEWMGVDKIPFKSNIEEGGRQSAKYTPPDPIEVEVCASDFRIAINSSFATRGEMFRSMTWEHTAAVTIIPKEEKGLGWYEDCLNNLQRLFALLVGRPVHVTSLTVHVQGEYEEVRYGELQGPVDYVSTARSSILREEVEPPSWYWYFRHVLVPFGSIESDIERVFNAWFDKAETLGPIYDLFFGTLYNRRLYGDAKFLNLMQALEIYHARTASIDRYVPDEEYRAYRKAMLSALPKTLPADIRNVFAQKLVYVNTYTLKTRLNKMLDNRGIDKVKVALVEGVNDPNGAPSHTGESMDDALNEVTKLLTNTRNYLTHRVEDQSRPTLTEAEMIEINPKLQLWLISMLLDDIGVDGGTIAAALDKFINKNTVRVLRI